MDIERELPDWPHQAIQTVAIWYIRKSCMKEREWRYTRILEVHPIAAKSISLNSGELPIVSCQVNQDSWYLMTSERLVGQYEGLNFLAKPLDIKRWKWGNFKTGLEPRLGIARIYMEIGVHHAFQYETGHASMAPIYYDNFWAVKYPALNNLDIDRLRLEAGLV